MNIQETITRGDIATAIYDPAPAVGRYQGNGRFGAVFTQLGLHAHPRDKIASDAYGQSQFTHLGHWGRFAFRSAANKADTTADYILPLARLYWENEPREVCDYAQAQSFYEGTLTTGFACAGGSRVTVCSWFDPVRRDLAAFQFDVVGGVSPVILGTDTAFNPYRYAYPGLVRQEVGARRERDGWVLEITCVSATPPTVSRVHVRTEARVEASAEGLRIYPTEGRSTVYLSYGEAVSADDAAGSLERTRRHWRETWEKSAWFDFPDDHAQQLWVRSLAYILYSFNDDNLGFAPTNGLTGNPFPFNFAQDLFYVQPILLASGHHRVMQAWIERFRALIPGMQTYAKHLWPEVEGIYPPWELPFGPIEGYHQPSIPIRFCHQPHNAAYVARMAHETGLAVNDPAWTHANVIPLVREVARFFASFCRKEADGRWHFFLTPTIGQDEAGGSNQKDYLCTLYGAKYAFQKAIEHGLDPDGAYAAILADGLAFDALLSPEGFYYASAGAGPNDFGRQKHPVQLNGLAYLPVESTPLAPERTAHALRYATTARARDPFFYGWTLGEFLLASTHLGDAEAWRKDFAQIAPSRYTDPDWVQLYETSGTTYQSFYVTTHGLVAQSLAHNVVSDYWGRLEIGACLDSADAAPVRFGNVRSLLGVTVSGEISGAGARVTLHAWKTCDLTVNGTRVSLRAGETRELTPPSSPSSSPALTT
ncbi:MAG: hypothetical protein H7Y06_00820 [Opitutaceae bacterium]|nr:hypothetical protein [Opitutaceae bacterium]